MNIAQERTVGDLVAERPSRSRIFEKYAIDYCCGGSRSLADACRDAGVDAVSLGAELADSDAEATETGTDWTRASLDALCEHLVATHHVYLRAELPRIAALAEKVAAAHGERHAELLEVRDLFRAFEEEMYAHLMKEEQVLFPLVRQLELGARDGGFHCGSIANPIRVMIFEHDSAGAALARFRALTSGFRAPEDACGSYLALLDALRELEADTHQHIHKENNVLFPRVLATV